MAISVEWDDEAHTVVRMSSQETWDLAELQRASQQAAALIKNTPHIVYVISDFSQTHTIPLGILWEMRHLNKIIPSNWGGSVVIAQDSFASTFVATLNQTYMGRNENRLFIVKSEVEAYEVIAKLKQQDQRL